MAQDGITLRQEGEQLIAEVHEEYPKNQLDTLQTTLREILKPFANIAQSTIPVILRRKPAAEESM